MAIKTCQECIIDLVHVWIFLIVSELKPDQEPISECITGLVGTFWCYQNQTEPDYNPNRDRTGFLKYPNGVVFLEPKTRHPIGPPITQAYICISIAIMLK